MIALSITSLKYLLFFVTFLRSNLILIAFIASQYIKALPIIWILKMKFTIGLNMHVYFTFNFQNRFLELKSYYLQYARHFIADNTQWGRSSKMNNIHMLFIRNPKDLIMNTTNHNHVLSVSNKSSNIKLILNITMHMYLTYAYRLM